MLSFWTTNDTRKGIKHSEVTCMELTPNLSKRKEQNKPFEIYCHISTKSLKPFPVGFGQNKLGAFLESLGPPLSRSRVNTAIAGFKRPEIKATPSHQLYYKAPLQNPFPLHLIKRNKLSKPLPVTKQLFVCLQTAQSIHLIGRCLGFVSL